MIFSLIEYEKIRYGVFKWRYELATVNKIILAFLVASLTGAAAQIRIPLPFTPVPITGQTFAVLLSGMILGRCYGGLSQLFYVGLGIAGVPWFSGWRGGVSHLVGPTGGYIIGFILAALFVGYFTERYIKFRYFLPSLFIMVVANFLFIHGFGLLHLYLWSLLVKKAPVSFSTLLMMGTLPFIPGDIIKATGAALLTEGITPKRAYNGEIDA